MEVTTRKKQLKELKMISYHSDMEDEGSQKLMFSMISLFLLNDFFIIHD